jgi:iron(III) transport system substrate-binding protein
MKIFIRFLTICVVFSLMASCAGTPTPTAAPATEQPIQATQPPATQPQATKPQPTQPPPTQPQPTEVPLTANEQWAKDNGLGPYQPATEDWAAVEAAANLEGSVCVYANSSKFTKLIEPFHALYPNITLECGDTDNIDVKMREEQKAGNVVGDIWYNSDGHILYGEFVPNEWIWAYVPPGVVEPELTPEQPIAVERHGFDVWGYNSEVHPEGCPLTNWWQLVEPALAGKVYIEDPLTDVSTMAKWATIAEHGDQMAAEYKAFYGVEWTTDPAAAIDPFTGEGPLNAGWLFIKRMAQNHPGVEPGGDEVDAAFATVGMDKTVEPGYGWTGYDSIENTLAGESAMMPCDTLTPMGILKTNYLAVANHAPHPNAAKLFIKFALTPEGYKPWNALGTYPAVLGWPLPEGAIPLADVLGGKGWLMNPVYDWQWAAKVRDFWAVSMLTPKPEE